MTRNSIKETTLLSSHANLLSKTRHQGRPRGRVWKNLGKAGVCPAGKPAFDSCTEGGGTRRASTKGKKKNPPLKGLDREGNRDRGKGGKTLYSNSSEKRVQKRRLRRTVLVGTKYSGPKGLLQLP